MKLFNKHILAVLLACGATAAQAVTIGFDDLSDGADVGNAYAGIGVFFTGARALDTTGPNGNPFFPPSSPNNVAEPNSFDPVRAEGATSWSSVGALFSSGEIVTLAAYNLIDGLLATISGGPSDPFGPDIQNFSLSLSVLAGDPQIDYVLISSSLGNFFAFDDFTVELSTAQSPGVPDGGSTSILFASALGGLGLLRRKLGLS